MKILPILVVEDDQDLLEAVCTTIQLSGYEAIPAANGQDALNVIQMQPIGMVAKKKME